MTINDFEKMKGDELITFISWKAEYFEEAKLAFTVFCFRYEKDLQQKAEIYCSKFEYNESIALMAVECSFGRVWNYPTFDMKKSHVKDENKAILLWMYRILYTQIILFKNRDTCAQPTEEEDLTLINNLDEYASFSSKENLEKKKELIEKCSIIESALQGLSQKHKIIYFTYLAYELPKKNIPRSITKKLREHLDLTQNSIRVYNNEAVKHVESYINKINGK